MQHHARFAPLALAFALAATAAHAQEARSPALPPVIVEAAEALCFPVVHEGGDLDTLTATYASPGLSGRKQSSWITSRWAWEEAPSADGPAPAVLHVNAGNDACELGYEFLDEDTDTSAIGEQVKHWVASLPGFTPAKLTDDFAVWVNAEQGTELILSTSYSKGVVFVSYRRQ